MVQHIQQQKKKTDFKRKTLIYLVALFLLIGGVILPNLNRKHFDDKHPVPDNFPILLSANPPAWVNVKDADGLFDDLIRHDSEFYMGNMHIELTKLSHDVYQLKAKNWLQTSTRKYKIDEKNKQVIAISQQVSGLILWLFAFLYALAATVVVVLIQLLWLKNRQRHKTNTAAFRQPENKKINVTKRKSIQKKKKTFNFNTLIFLMSFFLLMGGLVFPYLNRTTYDENNPPPTNFPLVAGGENISPYLVDYQGYGKGEMLQRLLTENSDFNFEQNQIHFRKMPNQVYKIEIVNEIARETYFYQIDEANERVIPQSKRLMGVIIWIWALASLVAATLLILVGKLLIFWWHKSENQH